MIPLKTYEAMAHECDRLTRENQQLREQRHTDAVKAIRRFEKGDAVVYVPEGLKCVVLDPRPNGMVEVIVPGVEGFVLAHSTQLIADRQDLNISYEAVQKLISMAEALQAGIYGDPNSSVNQAEIDEVLAEIRGPEANTAIINRFKARAAKQGASCQSH